jgi:mono/diheme cytochrome c family protein
MGDESGALEVRDATEFAPDTLPADVAAGRSLFYATNDSQMASAGAGVSCATCHFAGRNDGLTWLFADEDENLPDHARQTPSLAGVVSMTAPVTWTDDVVSVFDEVVITSQGRMGGSGLTEADALKVATFVDWTREADVPLAGSTSDSVLAGKEVFEREDVGCADCHSGAAFTDNEAYDMYGLTGVRTRSLVGVSASAPFLHDGSAPTIEAVLLRANDGSMGDTSSLTKDELEDLANYVKSL